MKSLFVLAVLLLLPACTQAEPVMPLEVAPTESRATDTPLPGFDVARTQATLEAARSTAQAVSMKATAVASATNAAAAASATAQALRIMADQATQVGVAKQLTVTSDRASASATWSAIRVEATATAEAASASASQTATARSLVAFQMARNATATLRADEIQAAQTQQQATATAQAMNIIVLDEQAQAERDRDWNKFYDSLLRAVIVFAVIVAFSLGFIYLNRYLGAITSTYTARRLLMETRVGTVQLRPDGRGGYLAQRVETTVTHELTPRTQEEASQAEVVDAEAEPLLKITSGHKTVYIAARDPDAEQAERHRRLALRLLRANMQRYGSSVGRIAGWRELDWPSETWEKAVKLLRPFLEVRQGRGGGTWCREEYPTLSALYGAVSARRVTLASPTEDDGPAETISVS